MFNLPSLIVILATLSLALATPTGRNVTDGLPDGLVPGNLGAIAGLPGVEETFDYIVIGGGTGGNAIGVRLAEAGHKVAIIEAGEYYEIGEIVLASTPGGDIVFVGADITDSDPLVDWEFVTEPQTGADNREVHYARGKCLGGSSALNFMVYHRGTKGSFDKWAELVGDESYTFENVFPYYEKSPGFTPPNEEKRAANATPRYNPDAFSSLGGPLRVTFSNYASPFSSWVSKGLHAIGLPDAYDFNSGVLDGSQYVTTTIRASDQTRSSSQTSFLKSAMDQNLQTLKVYIGTQAEKILFDDNKVATGVQVNTAGIGYTLHASKEVILSAGTFQSPQVLLLSGIGAKETLEQFNIPVIADLPGVGQNMWDHILFGPTYRVDVDTYTKVIRDPAFLAEAVVSYITNQTGPLAGNVADYLGFERLPKAYLDQLSESARHDLATFPSDWPHIEYIVAPGYVGNFGNLPLNQPFDGYEYGTILAAIIAPLSRGNVTLKSASITDKPLINPNWLTSDTDVQVAIAAFKRAREAFESNAMKPILIGDEYYPGKNVQTDEEILDVIRKSLMTFWHASCTNKMGKSDDPLAVVDSQARVFGVKGLRVVDGSALPLLPPGHPQSTIYMLAEKIADNIIKGSS
ncbi:CAZyme family AA3 [Paecilomyces variotii]|nr:CAZyme family AA3 [Paecilomyces variotii]